MKFTNVKQLIIKFMGGGLINFPTRFLRWVKINGDTDGDDSGGGESNLTFLENMVKEQAIKPIAYAYYIYSENKYYIIDDTSNFNSIPDIVEFFNDNPTYDKVLFPLYSSDENFDDNTYYLSNYDCAIEAYGSLIRYGNYTTEVTIDGNNYYILEG